MTADASLLMVSRSRNAVMASDTESKNSSWLVRLAKSSKSWLVRLARIHGPGAELRQIRADQARLAAFLQQHGGSAQPGVAGMAARPWARTA